MGSITASISSACRNRSSEKRNQILDLIDMIPFMNRQDDTCYDLVSSNFFDLNDGSGCFQYKQESAKLKYIISIADNFLKDTMKQNKSVRNEIEKLIIDRIQPECDEDGIRYINRRGETERLEDSAVEALKVVKNESHRLNMIMQENISQTISLLNKSGCVVLSDTAKKRIATAAESAVEKLDYEELSEKFIELYKEAGLNVPICNESIIFGGALRAAAAEYATLFLVFQGKLLSRTIRDC